MYPEVTTTEINLQYDSKKDEFIIIKRVNHGRKQIMRLRYSDGLELKNYLEFVEKRLMK